MGASTTRAVVDLLRWPVVGSFLRWKHARTTVQLSLLGAAAVVVAHGFVGPDLGSANLATVLTWVHYRGLLVVALLAAGNLFCAGCPFIRVRDWGRRLHMPVRLWPARLGGKWIALLLFAAVLFCYELFDLWSLPRATAWLVLAYFAGALVIDLVFTGATFCKHLCPVGQFNFVASTLSPLELRIRESSTCEACVTADCIKGRRAPESEPAKAAGTGTAAGLQRGCELGLFLPAKVGNLDCTFCLDCVQACPYDNIGLVARTPGLELADDSRRSSIGRLPARSDLAALAVLFVFGALVNAFAMTGAGRRAQLALGDLLGTSTDALVLGTLFAAGVIVAPAVLMGAAAAVSRRLASHHAESVVQVAQRYVYGLVPFGFGVWAAHYGFHLLTGVLVVVPVAQSAAIDLTGWPLLGEPLWQWAGMRPGAVLPVQLGLVLLGAIGSLGVSTLIAERHDPGRASRVVRPWMVLIVAVTAIAMWLFFQPMDLRGTGMGG